ncbi:NUDIX hydrolase [Candidatus Woesearchaeota archaeon]|nr:NUDIX hydrolase [Candidatus Woesearchaeota archaeon]
MQEKRPRLGAATIVIHDDKILLGRRNKTNANGMWVIPGGGVDWGEHSREAAVREIKEETNLDIELIRFVGYHEIINVPANYHAIVAFYLAKLKSSHFELEASEDLDNAGFYTLEDIKKMNCVDSVEWALKEASIWK